jgi:hypothetical protein
MTLEQIIEQERIERQAYEARTVVTREGETIQVLRMAFDSICDESNWKSAWSATVNVQYVGLVMRAVEFFHGAKPELVGVEPLTGHILMRGNGYAAD